MTRFIFVRHGQTEWNLLRRYQGHSDIPLNETGIWQAQQLAKRLKSHKIDYVFSSDLQRAVKTAEIIRADRDIPVQQDVRLRELFFGVKEGQSFDEGERHWPAVVDRLNEHKKNPPEGGERLDQLSQRVGSFLEETSRQCEGKSVLIVAHSGTIRAMLEQLFPQAQPYMVFMLDHASVSEVQVEGDHVIIHRLNDAGHLHV